MIGWALTLLACLGLTPQATRRVGAVKPRRLDAPAAAGLQRLSYPLRRASSGMRGTFAEGAATGLSPFPLGSPK